MIRHPHTSLRPLAVSALRPALHREKRCNVSDVVQSSLNETKENLVPLLSQAPDTIITRLPMAIFLSYLRTEHDASSDSTNDH